MGMAPVIPPKRSRKSPQEYDEALYQARYPVENGFCKLKEWRSVATRYARACGQILIGGKPQLIGAVSAPILGGKFGS